MNRDTTLLDEALLIPLALHGRADEIPPGCGYIILRNGDMPCKLGRMYGRTVRFDVRREEEGPDNPLAAVQCPHEMQLIRYPTTAFERVGVLYWCEHGCGNVLNKLDLPSEEERAFGWHDPSGSPTAITQMLANEHLLCATVRALLVAADEGGKLVSAGSLEIGNREYSKIAQLQLKVLDAIVVHMKGNCPSCPEQEHQS